MLILISSVRGKAHGFSRGDYVTNLFRASLQGVGDYRHIFLPWHARPDRDERWHAVTKAEMFAQRGTDDDFFAEYPGTPEEALAP